MERTTMKFVMIKKSCLRFFVLLLSLYLLSVQNTVNALTFKTDGFSVTTIDDTSFARMKGKTYKDYKYEYDNLSNEEKQKIVSLFSNK